MKDNVHVQLCGKVAVFNKADHSVISERQKGRECLFEFNRKEIERLSVQIGMLENMQSPYRSKAFDESLQRLKKKRSCLQLKLRMVEDEY